MAISSDQCDVTKSRVVKRCVQQDPILQYFHYTDIIDVNNFKSMAKNKLWKMNQKVKSFRYIFPLFRYFNLFT